ncbi:MAG TPA: acyltransferase [Holosporales bacterium]|nr:acyltransferase [Holosporales bacterium]
MRIIGMFRKFKQVFEILHVRVKYNSLNMAEYYRQRGAKVGKDCWLTFGSLPAEPYLLKIGDHVGIATGVKLLTHSLGWNYRDRIPDLQIFGKIEIGNNCNIGVNAIILPNVKIGDNCIIAAGAVVTKDIPANSIAGGIPAKVIGNAEDYFEVARKIWEEQKPEGYCKEMQDGVYYSPGVFTSLRTQPHYQEMLRKHLEKLFWE